MSFNLYRNGSEITSNVLSYSRNQELCSGVGSLEFTTHIDDPTIYTTWDLIEPYEDGILKGKFYISTIDKTVIPGRISISCQDSSKRITDYFVSQMYDVTEGSYTKTYIELILSLAGVSYTFNVSGSGNQMPEQKIGLDNAFSIITTLLQQSGWYLLFNSTGVAIIGDIDRSESIVESFDEEDILNVSVNESDSKLRNRAVVYGGRGVNAERSRITPWNYGSGDYRSVVIANGYIRNQSDANDLAATLLSEFDTIEIVKEIEVTGFRDVSVGDSISVESRIFSGDAKVTSLSSRLDSKGHTTVLILDQRCQRLFGYYSVYYEGSSNYVYVGTWGSGVWRKRLTSSIWQEYNDGLTNLYISDLFVKNGILVAVADNGYAYKRRTSWTAWNRIFHENFTDDSGNTYAEADVIAIACSMNSLNNLVIGYSYTGGNQSWTYTSNVDGSGITKEFITIEDASVLPGSPSGEVKIVDLECAPKCNVITAYSGTGGTVVPYGDVDYGTAVNSSTYTGLGAPQTRSYTYFPSGKAVLEEGADYMYDEASISLSCSPHQSYTSTDKDFIYLTRDGSSLITLYHYIFENDGITLYHSGLIDPDPFLFTVGTSLGIVYNSGVYYILAILGLGGYAHVVYTIAGGGVRTNGSGLTISGGEYQHNGRIYQGGSYVDIVTVAEYIEDTSYPTGYTSSGGAVSTPTSLGAHLLYKYYEHTWVEGYGYAYKGFKFYNQVFGGSPSEIFDTVELDDIIQQPGGVYQSGGILIFQSGTGYTTAGYLQRRFLSRELVGSVPKSTFTMVFNYNVGSGFSAGTVYEGTSPDYPDGKTTDLTDYIAAGGFLVSKILNSEVAVVEPNRVLFFNSEFASTGIVDLSSVGTVVGVSSKTDDGDDSVYVRINTGLGYTKVYGISHSAIVKEYTSQLPAKTVYDGNFSTNHFSWTDINVLGYFYGYNVRLSGTKVVLEHNNNEFIPRYIPRHDSKIEISKDYPVVVWNEFDMYTSPIPSGPWVSKINYTQFDDARVYDQKIPTGYDRRIAFINSDINMLLYTNPELDTSGIIYDFNLLGTIPKKVEISNFPTDPYIFVTTSGPQQFYQKNPLAVTYTNMSTNLPSAEVTIIRLDDKL